MGNVSSLRSPIPPRPLDRATRCVRVVERLAADAPPPALLDFGPEPVFAWETEGLAIRAAGRIAGFDVASDADVARLRGRLDSAGAPAPPALPVWVGARTFDGAPGRDEWRGVPGSAFFLPAWLWARTPDGTWLVRHALRGEPLPPAPSAAPAARGRAITAPAVDVEPRAAYADWVTAATDAIEAGAFDKVVLARRVRVAGARPSPGATWARLDAHPGLVRFRLGWPGVGELLGATPETLLRLDGDRVVTEALAGTAPAADAAALATSDKDLREHAAVVHGLRIALAATGLAAGITTDGPAPVTYGPIAHLRTVVRARLRGPSGFFAWLDQLHPSPAIAGAPRDAALAFIRATEPRHRGLYAGVVGVLDAEARGHAVVALRSGLLEPDGAWLYAGAGIVRGSDPAREHEETALKLRRMASALAEVAP
ncbi:MAG: isochorismate synthase [Deltaproteobacteria bacterium]|nr:isochorismate synthase [Deltaproteobacteria bacterium]